MTTTTAQSAILNSLRNQQPHPMFASRTQQQPTRRPEVKTMSQPTSQPQRFRFTFADATAAANQLQPGRYALPRRQASQAGNTVTFFKVFETRTGNRIVQLVASGGHDYVEQRLTSDMQVYAARHIAEDPQAAFALYGQTTGTCGVCGRVLSDETSRRLGIGPVCRNK